MTRAEAQTAYMLGLGVKHRSFEIDWMKRAPSGDAVIARPSGRDCVAYDIGKLFGVDYDSDWQDDWALVGGLA